MLTGLAFEEWMRKAICSQTDPELFFPPKGGNAAPAKRVCFRCPVIVECRAYALSRTDLDGIWGGTTPTDRQRLRGASRGQEWAS